MTVTLYSIAASHPGLAVRGMLAHKRIDHRVVDLWPGMQPLVRAIGFPRHTVPALILADGRRVEEVERWAEEVLQPVPRRIFRWTAAHHAAVRAWTGAEAGVPFASLLARPALQARLFARDAGACDAAVRADLAALPALLEEIEALLAEGVLGGPQRTAADFQVAASLRSLETLGDLVPLLAGHPTIAWAATVVPPLPGPTPPGLPASWLRGTVQR